jgi:tetratricopeptide (TPR) repeat protein
MSDTEKKKLKRKRRARGVAGQGKTRKTLEAKPALKLVSTSGPRLTESVFAEPSPMMSGRDERSDLDQAQELIYEAWEATTAARGIALAQKALALSPDCADGYLFLAEREADPAAARRLLEEGVAAGARAIGPRAFEKDVGHFWALLETRPYMRARAALAKMLWDQGERADAVAHWEELLRLNPNDNQGVRKTLVGHLIELGRDADAQSLLARYDEENAWMSYARALLVFRREGRSLDAQTALARAREVNRYVPAYLTGKKPLPRFLPDHHRMGDDAEAMCYAAEGLAAWHATRDALTWLKAGGA